MTKTDAKKILVAIDDSGYKNKVIAYAITLGKALDSEIVAVHVASLGPVGDMLGYYRGGKVEEYQKALTKKAEALLDEAKTAGQKEGLQIKTAVLTGSDSIADTIIGYAKDNNMDLIVVGTMGMTGIQKFLLGSVASNVISHAHCPVLAVR